MEVKKYLLKIFLKYCVELVQKTVNKDKNICRRDRFRMFIKTDQETMAEYKITNLAEEIHYIIKAIQRSMKSIKMEIINPEDTK